MSGFRLFGLGGVLMGELLSLFQYLREVLVIPCLILFFLLNREILILHLVEDIVRVSERLVLE